MKFLVTYYERNDETGAWELHKEIVNDECASLQCLFPVSAWFKLISIEVCDL